MRNKHERNFHYVAMHMIMSQILKLMDFTKTQKSRYLQNKKFFFQMKKSINNTSNYLMIIWQLYLRLIIIQFMGNESKY